MRHLNRSKELTHSARAVHNPDTLATLSVESGLPMLEIRAGLIGESKQLVTEDLTASSFGSGLVRVYATPVMIGLMESASVNAIRECLQAGETSVGIEIHVKHLAATPVGMQVRARAEVLSVDRGRVTFHVEAWDEKEKIGEGTHVRAIVDEARFEERTAQKQNQR